MLSSVSFLPSVAPTRVERFENSIALTTTTTKTTNRYFPSSRRKCLCASRGDDDDTATKQHASSLPTRKTTTDAVAKSSAVDYAMPNKLLSSDLSTVRRQVSQIGFNCRWFFFEFVVKNAPCLGAGRAPKKQQQQGKKFPKRCPRKVLTGGKFNTSVHYFFVRDDECLEIETNNTNFLFLFLSFSLSLSLIYRMRSKTLGFERIRCTSDRDFRIKKTAVALTGNDRPR